MLDLSPDSFRALARSSPWRWTSVHLRHRSGIAESTGSGEVEAWVDRQRGTRIVGARGEELIPREQVMPPSPPVVRADGLVAERLDHPIDDIDPMWTNYTWVAMLDPRELSHDVAIGDDLRQEQVSGRLAWRATLVPGPGYDPRCGGNCCELLWSEAGLWYDYSEDDPPPPERLGKDYPSAYDVALDVATGVVVRCLPIGGDPKAPWLENDIVSSH